MSYQRTKKSGFSMSLNSGYGLLGVRR